MIEKQLTDFDHEDRSSEIFPQANNSNLSLNEIDAQIALLEERIETGKTMIEAYQQEHGHENISYRRHLQKLKKDHKQLGLQRVELANRLLSFQEGKYKKALTAFNELMLLTFRKEFDTPKYKEQEELVRKLIREDEQLFELLFFSHE